jgi:SPP1 family predicted phage head-tail adaptor
MPLNSEIIRAGQLRKIITFQSRTTGQDAAGQPLATWTTQFTAYAAIEPLSGRELIQAQIAGAAVSHQITVRYRSELANPIDVAKMRIMYGTRVFNIQASMNQMEANRAVILQVQEGLNDG